MEDICSQLREKVLALRKPSQCARARKYFYPLSDLRECLTEDSLRSCILSISSLVENERDAFRFSSLIRSYALKTFSILLLDNNQAHILDFLFRREGDLRIPYIDEQGLDFLPKIVAHQFLDRQWEFDPVILEKSNIHLQLGDRAILPFLEDIKITRGGFGTLYKVKIHSSCQKLIPSTNFEDPFVARKELEESHNETREQAVLDLLQELQHPHIIPFLGSYTQFGIKNLLFPYISLNMRQFLESPHFIEAWSLYEGMYNLADALCNIHEFSFTYKGGIVNRIGYHHDLRPENILFKDMKFLIADFGLSKLKPDDEISKSALRGGHDDYLGPESFDQRTWTNNEVGRALDIWAFGCILAETLTVAEGRDVKNFKDSRKATQTQGSLTMINCAFHLNAQVRPAVKDWLSDVVAESTSKHTIGVVRLIYEMLNVNPYRRIKIPKVRESLAILCRDIKIEIIMQRFHRLTHEKDTRSSDADRLVFLEYQLLRAWNAASTRMRREEILESIDGCLSSLSNLHDALCNYEHLANEAQSASYMTEQMNSLNSISGAMDSLCTMLPAGLQTRIEDFWAHEVCEIQDFQTLEAIATSNKPARYRIVGIKAAMTYMSRIISSSIRSGKRSYTLDRGCVEIDSSSTIQLIQSSHLNLIKDESRVMGYYHTETEKRRSMIEWKQYDYRWQYNSGSELLETMDTLACLLDPTATPRQTIFKDCMLDCVGYIHQPEYYRFGFVYTVPRPEAGIDPDDINLFSLNNIIRITDPEKSDTIRPFLGDVFVLAQSLAACLTSLHQVGWLHKNLSSHHVLVFSPSAEQVHRYVISAVVAGFNDSRPEASSVTLGPSHELPHYHHPRYQQGIPFRRTFDYFSLGIVLLELGLWQPISTLCSDHQEITSSEEFLQKLVKTYVPMLGERMGRLYRDAVDFCLSADDNFGTDHVQNAESRWELHEQFRANVVNPLLSCKA